MSSSAGAGPSKRPRGHYSSQACNGCRRRRCKCDGTQPICGACELAGRECDWSKETDARRPVTKQLVDNLRAKIQQLEAEVELLRVPSSPATSNKSVTAPASAGRPSDAVPGSPARSGQPESDIRSLLELNESLQPGYDALDAERPQPPVSRLTTTVLYRYIFQIDNTVPAHEQSNDTRLSLVCDWSRYLPQLPDVAFSRQEHDTLLLRCFKYGTSWLLSLVPELFLHDMLYSLTSVKSEDLPQPRLQHYSPLLHCSIMAFATAFSDDPVIRAPTTRARFASWARQWLDEEFKQPAMSLARALALLAEYHCGAGEKNTGYMYMGMSIRAVRIFAAKSADGATLNDENVTPPESINQSWHFWSAFGYDKLMGIEYNRDYDIPIPHPEVSLPSIDEELDSQPWPLEQPSSSAPNITPSRSTTLAFHESCKLMMIATRIIDVVRRHESGTLEEKMVIDTHLRLDTWFNALPEKLLVWARSASPLPHLIVLHICYWWLMIVLHQPFYQKDPPSGQDAQRLPIGDLSIKLCDRAAHKIVQLVTMFDDQHGLRFYPRNMIEAICACGTALLREYASAPFAANKKRSNATNGINTCINSLRSISATWPYAEALADDLQSRIQERFNPVFSVVTVDGHGATASDDMLVDPQPDGDANVHKDEHMHDEGHIALMKGPVLLGPGSGASV